MPQFPLRLPNRNEAALIALALFALLFASWLRRGEKISSLEAIIAARPLVTDEAKVKVVTKVVEGPVRIVVKTVVAPDGTRTTEKTLDRESRVADRGAESETKHEERPICPAPYRPKTRYVRGTWDIAEGFLPRAGAAGLTWADRVDTGASYDRVYKAVGLEIGARW